jgi:hypothetical protein
MKMISLLAFIVFLTLITSQHILANLVHHSKKKYFKTFTNRSMLDVFAYPNRSYYNSCKSQSESSSGLRKTDHCPSYIKSKFKEWRIKHRSSINKKLKRKRSKAMKSGRCGVIDGLLFYAVENRW